MNDTYMTQYEIARTNLNVESKKTRQIIDNNWYRLSTLIIPYGDDKKALRLIVKIIIKNNLIGLLEKLDLTSNDRSCIYDVNGDIITDTDGQIGRPLWGATKNVIVFPDKQYIIDNIHSFLDIEPNVNIEKYSEILFNIAKLPIELALFELMNTVKSSFMQEIIDKQSSKIQTYNNKDTVWYRLYSLVLKNKIRIKEEDDKYKTLCIMLESLSDYNKAVIMCKKSRILGSDTVDDKDYKLTISLYYILYKIYTMYDKQVLNDNAAIIADITDNKIFEVNFEELLKYFDTVSEKVNSIKYEQYNQKYTYLWASGKTEEELMKLDQLELAALNYSCKLRVENNT